MSLPKCGEMTDTYPVATHDHRCICELPHTGDRHACSCGYHWPIGPTDRQPRGGYTRHGHPIPGLALYPPDRPPVARCGGPKLCRVCQADVAAATARETPQEPAGAPDVPPGVAEHLEAAGAALGAALAPLVAMVAERDDIIARMTVHLLNLQEHLAAVLPLTRPSWAQDVRTVEQAREALAQLAPTTEDRHG